MNALGNLNPIESVRASVQEKIADFLAARARLTRLMSSNNLQIQSEAKALYNIQLLLENTLMNEVNPKIQQMQTGAWDFSDVTMLGGFAVSLAKQISDVNNLVSKAGGLPADKTNPILFGLGIPALVLLGLVGGYLLSKR